MQKEDFENIRKDFREQEKMWEERWAMVLQKMDRREKERNVKEIERELRWRKEDKDKKKKTT